MRTLISRKGMRRLFSSLESKPRSLAANLKFLFVAAKAFMASSSSSSFSLSTLTLLGFDQNAVIKRLLKEEDWCQCDSNLLSVCIYLYTGT